MAGSLKWFVYTTDDGQDFAIKLDESNTEAINGSTQDYVSGLSLMYALPRNLRPRELLYSTANRARTIRCVALTATIFANAPANVPTIVDPIDGSTLVLRAINPEKIRNLPFAADTGLTDSDDT